MQQARVVVGVCTLDRPEGLTRLLAALGAQRLRRLADADVAVVIVDNSQTRSAEALVEARARDGRFRLIYRHEPRRGLSHARNAVLREASAMAPLLAFTDDDVMPSPDWLETLVETVESGGHAAAVGPIRPYFDGLPPAWAVEGGLFAMTPPLRDGLAREGYTCNCILRCAFAASHALTFDLGLNAIGGEDTLFFRMLQRAGGTIGYAPAAVAYESMPRGRVKTAWLMRRWFRTGGTEAILHPRGNQGLGGRAHNAGRGVVRLIYGTGLGLSAVPARLRGDSAAFHRAGFTLARGAGLLAASLGHTYQEYGQAHYRRGV